jgi:hypothetical protein
MAYMFDEVITRLFDQMIPSIRQFVHRPRPSEHTRFRDANRLTRWLDPSCRTAYAAALLSIAAPGRLAAAKLIWTTTSTVAASSAMAARCEKIVAIVTIFCVIQLFG